MKKLAIVTSFALFNYIPFRSNVLKGTRPQCWADCERPIPQTLPQEDLIVEEKTVEEEPVEEKTFEEEPVEEEP